MKKDIAQRAHLEVFMQAFYSRVMQDEQIGFLFTDVAHLDLEKHLPVITDFWESVVLNGNAYRGNPLVVHQRLHGLSPLTKAHFDRWLEVFYTTLDDLFAGPVAELTKTRALSIATMMQIKLSQASPSGVDHGKVGE